MFRELANNLMSQEFLVALAAAVLATCTVITLLMPMLKRDQFKDRMKAVANRREFLRRQNRASMANEQDRRLRRQESGLFKGMVEKFDLQRMLEDPKLNERLMQAGYRGQTPVHVFYTLRFALPFVFFLVGLLYLFGPANLELSVLQKVCIGILFAGIGFYLPTIYLANKAQKRQEEIVKGFPDALDLLLICVESGMSIEAAFAKVADEIQSSSPILAEEIALTNAELSYLQDRRQAYDNLARRSPNPGIKAVATSLIQSERYGTPLASSLRVMAKENRDMRMAAAEKKAAALPPKLTVPMILFFLPVLFVVILGPVIMKVQDLD